MNIDRQRMCHGFAAVTLLALTAWAPPSLALGEGFLPPCATLGNCSADLASGAAWSVRESVTNITGGFAMPTDLQAGVTTQQGQDVKLNASPELAGNGPLASNLNFALTEFYRGTAAQAQTDFGVNRVRTGQNSGVAGELTRGTGSATVRLETYASASSAWRDVWRFSACGHLSGVVAMDGFSSLGPIGTFGSSYDVSPLAASGDWFYDLRVWDVTHFSVSEQFELRGPTEVARVSLRGNHEQRATFDGTQALDFDFLSGTSYVIAAELRATSFNGREIDLYNTVRLRDLMLSGGAQLNALSGHDWVGGGVTAPVPEPSSVALMLAGLLMLLALGRRRFAG